MTTTSAETVDDNLKAPLTNSIADAYAKAEIIFAKVNTGELSFAEGDRQIDAILKAMEADVTKKITDEIVRNAIRETMKKLFNMPSPDASQTQTP